MKDSSVIELAKPAVGRAQTAPPVLSTSELLVLRNASALLTERAGPDSGVDALREAGLNAVTLIETLRPDAETLATAMLLPAFEAGVVDEQTVDARVDAAVTRMLRGAERIAELKELRHAEQRPLQIDRLRQMLLTMAEDPRVVLVRLAHQLCTMRAARTFSDDARRRLGEETLDVYAPLANRLGVGQLKWELEDLAFRFVNPSAYCAIADQVNERRAERELYIKKVLTQLVAELKRAGISSEVSGRPKHIYSIYRKTLRKNIGVDQVFDQIGLRVLVDEVADCYAALGLVHSLWAPVPSEFDDYIARPKANNYQSLHTAVIGPDTRTMEVQIRTYAMHRHAELGVAAHWQYKEKSPDWSAWSRRVLERQEGSRDDDDDGGDIIARYRDIAFHDRIYVITPQGRIIDLPTGATALDFAYAVHTDLGHQCRGAKSGGAILPLTQPLTSGSTVEILTGREGGPSRDWLNPQLGFLKSGTARAKVRRWFRDRDRAEHIGQGRSILERELRRLGAGDANFGELAQALSLDSADDLMAAIGRGDVTPAQLAQVLQPPPAPAAPIVPTTTPKATGASDVIVLGVSDVMTRTARCCSPLPGEAIGGYITVGQGVSIHRADCANLAKLRAERPERIMEVSWGEQPSAAHRAVIDIEAIDRRGLLRDVSDVFSNERVDILAVNTQTNEATNLAHMSFTIAVADLRQFEHLLRRLDRLADVRTVRRRS